MCRPLKLCRPVAHRVIIGAFDDRGDMDQVGIKAGNVLRPNYLARPSPCSAASASERPDLCQPAPDADVVPRQDRSELVPQCLGCLRHSLVQQDHRLVGAGFARHSHRQRSRQASNAAATARGLGTLQIDHQPHATLFRNLRRTCMRYSSTGRSDGNNGVAGSVGKSAFAAITATGSAVGSGAGASGSTSMGLNEPR